MFPTPAATSRQNFSTGFTAGQHPPSESQVLSDMPTNGSYVGVHCPGISIAVIRYPPMLLLKSLNESPRIRKDLSQQSGRRLDHLPQRIRYDG